ncbi:MAG: radical SAM protein [Lachnospiraceae bacterium]|nr:radical SAM protein [Lachnospiraceae bacterium]
MNTDEIKKIYFGCTLCPRKCSVNRYETEGFCRAGVLPKIARAALHMWEEPILSASGGSGAVFFSNCTLRCVFCQNHDISAEGFGKEISVKELSDVFLRLQDEGAQNIDLITASHYLPSVIEALDIVKHKLNIPVVYNCGGYENVDTVRMLKGYVDIYLPDIKYYSDELAVRFSAAPHYFETAIMAVKEMIAQTGVPIIEKSSATNVQSMKSGVIIRHMVLPKHRDDSIAMLNAIASVFDPDSFLISLMSQYTPFYKVLSDSSYKDINRRITSYEYDAVVKEALRLSLNGFMQEKSSAKEEYTPSFKLEGVP